MAAGLLVGSSPNVESPSSSTVAPVEATPSEGSLRNEHEGRGGKTKDQAGWMDAIYMTHLLSINIGQQHVLSSEAHLDPVIPI